MSNSESNSIPSSLEQQQARIEYGYMLLLLLIVGWGVVIKYNKNSASILICC